MTRSDFAWLNFDTEFVQANQEATRTFFIDDNPVPASRPGQSVSAEGFIMIQAEDVGNSSTAEGDAITHRILINGQHLPSFDMVARDGWNLWMDRVPSGILKKGENRLTVRRRAVDQFRIANIVVQWRERGRVGGGVIGADDLTVEA